MCAFKALVEAELAEGSDNRSSIFSDPAPFEKFRMAKLEKQAEDMHSLVSSRPRSEWPQEILIDLQAKDGRISNYLKLINRNFGGWCGGGIGR